MSAGPAIPRPRGWRGTNLEPALGSPWTKGLGVYDLRTALEPIEEVLADLQARRGAME